ncbi:hypothetical protein SteCoe_20866 [Stentor coeruleus]|uniref:Protein kinase domain-containing protein n=1 Tax=Stentor coeruleus TaxID=5963 RepID=A0A1R2BR14_9CILI|nr:hypothetical protein SteCoe_20866 [Stentor coeruleus]
MASIFSSIEDSKFWTKFSPEHQSYLSNPLFIGSLITKKSGQMIEHLYELTSTALIQLDHKGKPKKFTLPNWKLLDPFYEETLGELTFGFRLSHKDFFTNSSESLDIWLEWLKKTSIACTFEEDFAIIKEIGKGSSSTVYLVEDIETRKQYAAKCIKKSHIKAKKNAFRNLVQEIKALYKLKHPNIIELYYVYETSDCIYLILEYFPYGDLYKRVLKKNFFDKDDCVKFAKNLLDTLDYMHNEKVVHRDLKLENIMMINDNDYNFKIIDFGLCYEGEDYQNERCGSPGYIAPEMLKKCKYNHKVDIFSAGVILYIIITGQHPFNAKGTENILRKNMNCFIKDHPMLEKVEKDFVMNMLQALPQNRPEAIHLLDHPWIFNQKRSSICTILGSFSTRGGSVVIY